MWLIENNICDTTNLKLPSNWTALIWAECKHYCCGVLCPLGHFAGEDVKTKLAELHGRWETLKGKAAQRRQDLEDSLQAQQYFADANEAESWMREKEPIVGSPDYGKDEDSAEVSVEKCADFIIF